jgi:hypothetical protein
MSVIEACSESVQLKIKFICPGPVVLLPSLYAEISFNVFPNGLYVHTGKFTVKKGEKS